MPLGSIKESLILYRYVQSEGAGSKDATARCKHIYSNLAFFKGNLVFWFFLIEESISHSVTFTCCCAGFMIFFLLIKAQLKLIFQSCSIHEYTAPHIRCDYITG